MRIRVQLVFAVVLVLSGISAIGRSSASDVPLDSPLVAITTAGEEHWILQANGSVVPSEGADHFGDALQFVLGPDQQAVDIAATPEGTGYWVVTNDGGVFSFGNASFQGSLGDLLLDAEIVALVPTPTGEGYWLAAADGGIFAFGDADFLGSLGGLSLAAPIVDMVATPGGGGYWLAGKDGGVFTFGDAPYLGSAVSMEPSDWEFDVVAMAATQDGLGYRLVASYSTDYRFGSLAHTTPRHYVQLGDIIDIAAADGPRVVVLGADGSTIEHGDMIDINLGALSAARADWAAAGIDDYALAVRGNSGSWCHFSSLTTVHNGSSANFDRLSHSPYSECWLEPVLVEDLHDMIERALTVYRSNSQPDVIVSYNDAGVPTYYDFDVPVSADEETRLNFTFAPVDQNPPVPATPTGPEAREFSASNYSAIAADPDGDGYWTLMSDGSVYAQDAHDHDGADWFVPDAGTIAVDLAPDPSTDGYWIATSDGGVFSFGPAQFHGSLGDIDLAADVVSMKPTSSGNGYWLAGTDGGVFAFGDAGYFGGLGGIDLAEPIVDMAPTATGEGYWLVAADGGVFAFGDAVFLDSAHGRVDDGDAVRTIVRQADGYTLFTERGARAIFSHGHDPDFGYLDTWHAIDVAWNGTDYLVMEHDGTVIEYRTLVTDWGRTLANNRSTWESSTVDDYALMVETRGAGYCPAGANLAIVIAGVTQSSTGGSSNLTPDCAHPTTVTEWFDLLSGWLAREVGARIDIEFGGDGVPRSFEYVVPAGGGEYLQISALFAELG